MVKLGIPVELGAQLQRSRADGVGGKINLISVANHLFGLGLAGGAGWDLVTGEHTGVFINLPPTFALHENLRINVNAGWQYDNAAKLSYLT